MNYFSNDTIAAIATAPGDGAIAIIRLSGKKAFSIVNSLFSKDLNKMLSHTCHLGKFYDENKVLIDEVLLLIMKNPHSFTGEDVVEIHSHGGRIVTEKILKTLIQNGARAASAGEFSFRAFQNKKIDLTQAEAIQNLIAAKNEKALLAAEKHLEGALKRKVLSFQRNLLEITAILEAWVDFPEEELELTSIQEINKQIENEKKKLIQLIETYHDGKALFEGMTLAICGTPNVGKSSLLNALLKKDRAIVTDIEGTTRDLLEETIQIKNMHFKLIDTAGIRTTNDCIEKEGIKRSLLAIEKADIVILVLDASRPLAEDDRNLIKKADPQSTLLLWNKIDLKDPSDNLDFPFHAHISAQKE
ncbi:MAG TPA: tRNA uridine-5-carboxymethylaminomethyl(34) synthesis GTPase MnmE, partial [Chlamydiales bacterium]|nr:tRNA uridine-5-carboxymethylaminomethyl(34) synthesis GTPase MnmE [Chlamydiales bacterium]